MKAALSEHEFDRVLQGFEYRVFSTHEFIQSLASEFPSTWAALRRDYGEGGKGAKRHYSAFSRVAQALNLWSRNGKLDKLDYKKADAHLNWGSPVIRYWTRDKDRIHDEIFPDEVVPGTKVFEDGAVVSVCVNKYERDPVARRLCIEHHGHKCAACGFDFGQRYGARGIGFIHVHHCIPVSEYGGAKTIDPAKDLIPVCPNCHAMLHRERDGMTVEALRELLTK